MSNRISTVGELLKFENAPPPALTFTLPGGVEVGRLDLKDGKATFTGNADEAAKVFIEYVIEKYDATILDLRKKLAAAQGAWVSVEKGLPKIPRGAEFTPVLVAVKGETDSSEVLFGADGEFRGGYDEPPIVGVMYWRKLLETPPDCQALGRDPQYER